MFFIYNDTFIKKFNLVLMLVATFFVVCFSTPAYSALLPDENDNALDIGDNSYNSKKTVKKPTNQEDQPSILERIINQTATMFQKEDATSVDVKNKLTNYVNHFLRDKSLENITVYLQLIDTVKWNNSIVANGVSNSNNSSGVMKKNTAVLPYYIYNIFIDSNMTTDYHLDRSFYVVTNGQVVLSSMVDVVTHEDVVASKLAQKYASSQLDYTRFPVIIGNGTNQHKLVIFSTFDNKPAQYLFHRLSEERLGNIDVYFVNVGVDNFNILINKILLIGLKNGYNFSTKISDDVDKLKKLSTENVIRTFSQYVPEKKIFTRDLDDKLEANAEYGLHVYRKFQTNVSPMLIFDDKAYYMFDDNFIELVNTVDRKVKHEAEEKLKEAKKAEEDKEDGSTGDDSTDVSGEDNNKE